MNALEGNGRGQNEIEEARLKYFLFEIFFSVFRMALSRAKVRSAMRYSGYAIRYKANVAIATAMALSLSSCAIRFSLALIGYFHTSIA